MKRLSNILSSTEVISFTASSDIEIHALQYDSLKIEAGDCFFAVRGTQTDGHQYIDKAIEAGAAVVVILIVRKRRKAKEPVVQDA